MVPRDFDPPTGRRCDRKARLANVSPLDAARRRESKNNRATSANELLDGQPLPVNGIIDQTCSSYALSDSGPCRNDDQVRLLKTAGFCIQIVEAGWHSRNHRLVFVDRLDLVPGVLEDVLESDKVLGDATLGDVEDDALRGIERLARGRAFIEAEGGDPPAGADQLSLGGAFFDQVAVVLDVGRRGHTALQLSEKRLATDPFQDAHPFQFSSKCQQVDRVGTVVEIE